FDDNMPPGLLAQTRTNTVNDASAVSAALNAQGFVPIVRSKIQLHRDLNASHQASYSDAFFTTLVHEFGHSLGLQHTMTASAMTNPDGTYRIEGIPAGQYYVYVHPLPPAVQGEASPANIVAPQDPSGKAFPANTGFDTQFFPGTKDWTQAFPMNVNPGASVDN